MAEAATEAPRGAFDKLAFWAVAAVAAALFAAMPAWRGYAPPPVETYAIAAEDFAAKVDAMVAAHATGEVTKEGIPVVRPPAGDVYVQAQRWQFWPIVELAPGESYRLHVASIDILHGFHLTDRMDMMLLPGSAHAFDVTPVDGERIVMQCSEYCGIEHNRMKATLRVLPRSGS